MPMHPWYVYMLRCTDGTLYTGVATDVDRRFREHQAGRGAKYTRAHPAEEVVYRELCTSRGEALTREYAIKQLSAREKRVLCEQQSLVVLDTKTGHAGVAGCVSRYVGNGYA